MDQLKVCFYFSGLIADISFTCHKIHIYMLIKGRQTLTNTASTLTHTTRQLLTNHYTRNPVWQFRPDPINWSVQLQKLEILDKGRIGNILSMY